MSGITGMDTMRLGVEELCGTRANRVGERRGGGASRQAPFLYPRWSAVAADTEPQSFRFPMTVNAYVRVYFHFEYVHLQ